MLPHLYCEKREFTLKEYNNWRAWMFNLGVWKALAEDLERLPSAPKTPCDSDRRSARSSVRWYQVSEQSFWLLMAQAIPSVLPSPETVTCTFLCKHMLQWISAWLLQCSPSSEKPKPEFRSDIYCTNSSRGKQPFHHASWGSKIPWKMIY